MNGSTPQHFSLWSDIHTVVWKEFKELTPRREDGSGRGWISVILLIAIFGIFMPSQFGSEWVTSPIMLIYWAWLPLLLVSGVVAQSFAGERERHTLESLLATRLPDRAIRIGKVAASAGYAWGITLVALAVGLVTVNVQHSGGGWLMYRGDLMLLPIVTLLISVLGATAGALISLRATTVRQAQQVMSVALLFIVFGSTYGLEALGVNWGALVGDAAQGQSPSALIYSALGLVALVDLGLLAALSATFRRSRLIAP